MRVFAAIEITNDKIREQLFDITQKMCESGRPVAPSQYHITLKFFGDDVSRQEVQTIKEKMSEITVSSQSFEVRGVGAFPSHDYITVLWAGTDDRITPVINAFEKQFALREDYTPHVTLCRFDTLPPQEKKKVQTFLSEHEDTVFGKETATEIVLKKSTLTSEGPVYDTIHTVQLS